MAAQLDVCCNSRRCMATDIEDAMGVALRAAAFPARQQLVPVLSLVLCSSGPVLACPLGPYQCRRLQWPLWWRVQMLASQSSRPATWQESADASSAIPKTSRSLSLS